MANPTNPAPAPRLLGYRAAKATLGAPLRTAFDVDVHDAEHLPGAGAAILAANHRSFMDSVFLALVAPRPVSFLAKAEYFDRRRTAWLFRAGGQIPVRRGSPAGARRAMQTALQVLDGGGIVGVYPEGTRSRDGLLHRGTLGAVRLAAGSGAPLVPVGLVGTDAVQAPDRRLPRLHTKVRVHFGEPWHVAPNDGADRRRLRAATDRLMHDIAALSGQTYTAEPAPRRTA